MQFTFRSPFACTSILFCFKSGCVFNYPKVQKIGKIIMRNILFEANFNWMQECSEWIGVSTNISTNNFVKSFKCLLSFCCLAPKRFRFNLHWSEWKDDGRKLNLIQAILKAAIRERARGKIEFILIDPTWIVKRQDKKTHRIAHLHIWCFSTSTTKKMKIERNVHVCKVCKLCVYIFPFCRRSPSPIYSLKGLIRFAASLCSVCRVFFVYTLNAVQCAMFSL